MWGGHSDDYGWLPNWDRSQSMMHGAFDQSRHISTFWLMCRAGELLVCSTQDMGHGLDCQFAIGVVIKASDDSAFILSRHIVEFLYRRAM